LEHGERQKVKMSEPGNVLNKTLGGDTTGTGKKLKKQEIRAKGCLLSRCPPRRVGKKKKKSSNVRKIRSLGKKVVGGEKGEKGGGGGMAWGQGLSGGVTQYGLSEKGWLLG